MTDLTDLVRRLRSLVTPSSIGNEAADALSRLIELERRVKEAPLLEPWECDNRHWVVSVADMVAPKEGARFRVLLEE